MHRVIKLGTRGSQLALWQANHVKVLLQNAAPNLVFELVIIKTTGDKDQKSSLTKIGGMGVFTKAIEDALLAGTIDIAIHSLKDLPSKLGHNLLLASVPDRAAVADILVTKTGMGLQDLPRHARIATGSIRRRSQLLAIRPDLSIFDLRGNIDTRLGKLEHDGLDAIIMAKAAIDRLALHHVKYSVLSVDEMIPAVGQGAIGIETRCDDTEVTEIVARINHKPTYHAVSAERAFLRRLDSGCQFPIGAYALINNEDELTISGFVGDVHGLKILKKEKRGFLQDAEKLGESLAEEMIAEGALDLLKPLFALADKRILVTRSPQQAGAFVTEIERFGGTAVCFPTFVIQEPESWEEMDDAISRLNDFDWIVFSSPNSVRFFMNRLKTLNLDLPSIQIAVVGSKSDSILKEFGFEPHILPKNFNATSLLKKLQNESMQGKRVLLPVSTIARNELCEGLQNLGAHVERVIVYQNNLNTPTNLNEVLEWIKNGSMDLLTFFSPSSIHNFLHLIDDETLQAIKQQKIPIAAIGPTSANAIRHMGLAVDIEPSNSTSDFLIQSIIDYFAHLKEK